MDVFTAVRTLRAVRAYEDRPVPHDVVQRIVEGARLSASSKNGQPWHFVVIDDRATLQQLGTLATSGPYTAQAAFAILVGVDHESPYGLSDASRAIQSMMLVGWEEGVGSNWVGFNNLNDLREMFGIPDGIDVVALLPFGYPAPAASPKGKKQRKPLGEVASHGRFGTPFA